MVCNFTNCWFTSAMGKSKKGGIPTKGIQYMGLLSPHDPVVRMSENTRKTVYQSHTTIILHP